jgi:hypothetical protein
MITCRMPTGSKIRRIENWLLEEWFAHPCPPNKVGALWIKNTVAATNGCVAAPTPIFLGHRSNDLGLAAATDISVTSECRQDMFVPQILRPSLVLLGRLTKLPAQKR